MSPANSGRTHHSSNEAEAMSRVARRLQQQFPELPAEAIDHAVYGHYEQFNGRPARDFVPILVERAAHHDLANGNRTSR